MRIAVCKTQYTPYEDALFRRISEFNICVNYVVVGSFSNQRPHWIQQDTTRISPYYKRTMIAAFEVPLKRDFKEKISYELLSLLKKRKYDIAVMNFGLPSTLFYSLYAKSTGSRIISHNTVHTSHATFLKALNEPVNRLSILFSDKFITLTNFHKNFLVQRGVNPKKIFIIPHGVDVEKFNETKNSKPLKTELAISNKKIVLFVGRLEKEKGIEYLVNAMKIIISFEKNAHLLIVGTGTSESYFKTLVQRLQLTEHVTFVGSVPSSKINQYYAICDVHVAPSLLTKTFVEPFGMVFLEAMASGKPSVAFDIPAPVREIIVNGETGYLVPEKNVAEFADKICGLLHDDAKRTEMGNKAKKRVVERYAIDTIAEKWVKALEKTI